MPPLSCTRLAWGESECLTRLVAGWSAIPPPIDILGQALDWYLRLLRYSFSRPHQ